MNYKYRFFLHIKVILFNARTMKILSESLKCKEYEKVYKEHETFIRTSFCKSRFAKIQRCESKKGSYKIIKLIIFT